jgi:hypothetical protein
VIEGQEKITLADWSQGRHTSDNQATVPNNALLVARNIIRQIGALKPTPGYTLVQDTTLKLIERLYSFERQTDQQQFLMVTGGQQIARCKIDGSAPPAIMSNAEADGDFDFVENAFALFANNGARAWKLINIEGVETIVPWGLQPAVGPPAIALGNGGLNLTYGTRYVYSEVFRWTDSLGTERYHISVPSDFSAHSGPLGLTVTDGAMNATSALLDSGTAGFTAGDVGTQIVVEGAGPSGGPLAATIAAYISADSVTLSVPAVTTVVGATVNYRLKAVTLSDITAVNPQTTHFWIFRVQDSPIGASGTYFFVAEIPVAQSTYVDDAADVDLDTTREAPFLNYPPPLGNIMLEYGGRAVILNGDTVYLSALSEISLGVAYECFPAELEFIVPGGIKNLTAGIIFQQQALLSTQDYWFQISGQDITTFQMLDQVIKPGSIGRKTVLVVHGRLIWLGTDKKLWTWNGVIGTDPVPMSVSLHGNSLDQLNMSDLSTTYLAECELQWYSNGTFDWIVLVAASVDTTEGEKDWIQIWDLSPVTGVLTIQGPIPQPAESDFFPYDLFATSLSAESAGLPYIFFGGKDNGLVFRWPDGLLFNGLIVKDALVGTPWIQLADAKARPLFAKILTNMEDAKSNFHFAAIASKGVDPSIQPVDVDLEADVDGALIDDTVARANLMTQPGTSFGNWLKVFVAFPADVATEDTLPDLSLSAIEIYHKPLPGV